MFSIFESLKFRFWYILCAECQTTNSLLVLTTPIPPPPPPPPPQPIPPLSHTHIPPPLQTHTPPTPDNTQHMMMSSTFPCHWPFVRGIHRLLVDSPHKGPWHGAVMFSFMCTCRKVWANNRDAGDYSDVTVIVCVRWMGMADMNLVSFFLNLFCRLLILHFYRFYLYFIKCYLNICAPLHKCDAFTFCPLRCILWYRQVCFGCCCQIAWNIRLGKGLSYHISVFQYDPHFIVKHDQNTMFSCTQNNLFVQCNSYGHWRTTRALIQYILQKVLI